MPVEFSEKDQKCGGTVFSFHQPGPALALYAGLRLRYYSGLFLSLIHILFPWQPDYPRIPADIADRVRGIPACAPPID